MNTHLPYIRMYGCIFRHNIMQRWLLLEWNTTWAGSGEEIPRAVKLWWWWFIMEDAGKVQCECPLVLQLYIGGQLGEVEGCSEESGASFSPHIFFHFLDNHLRQHQSVSRFLRAAPSRPSGGFLDSLELGDPAEPEHLCLSWPIIPRLW